MGNEEQWDEYEKKKSQVLSLHLREPYETLNQTSPIYQHWQSIVNGIVPFGYTVENK